ncbi:DUF4249 family protein [Neolewinella lacunae]|uniref:DUF4249 family protein n=1 Tax=Neolewinella lacunae TaxID=1517758 RepID=A0A923PFM2_9BACT|nr:DUF4249 family protein [Neolewinella lacunae]MBC6993182.1 DUF4249 family protein [Neolewinella lacunae]MDN3637101.1 DUF4249 family protein [Neolewinella lacunae]
MKLPLPLLALLLLLSLASCRDDFTLEGDYQDIPVAYAYLNAADARHFVRVQKAFLESGGNATENAAIADSIFYAPNEATVLLRNLRTQQEVELERVNGEQFSLNRADGVFATSPNVLYTVPDSEIQLNPADRVVLSIERPGQPTATAETVMLRPIEILRPGDLVRLDDYRSPLVMSWNKGDNARIYDVRVIFKVREIYPSNPSRNRDIALTWTVNPAFVPSMDQESGNSVRFEVDKEGFYRFIGNSLEPDAQVIRRFLSFDVQVSAAGQEVLDLRNLSNANSGLTSSQSLPRYTNLIGGIGLVTSNTTSLKEGIDFDDASRDSLRNGIHTRELGFL